MSEIVFAFVGANVKGNYKSIVISIKKKYEVVSWDGSLKTKGLTIVKKDSLSIVRYTLSRATNILNDETNELKIESLLALVDRVMNSLQFERLPVSS